MSFLITAETLSLNFLWTCDKSLESICLSLLLYLMKFNLAWFNKAGMHKITLLEYQCLHNITVQDYAHVQKCSVQNVKMVVSCPDLIFDYAIVIGKFVF